MKLRHFKSRENFPRFGCSKNSKSVFKFWFSSFWSSSKLFCSQAWVYKKSYRTVSSTLFINILHLFILSTPLEFTKLINCLFIEKKISLLECKKILQLYKFPQHPLHNKIIFQNGCLLSNKIIKNDKIMILRLNDIIELFFMTYWENESTPIFITSLIY